MKQEKKKKKMPNSYNKVFPFLLLIATLFMGIGYASINSITADITGIIAANTQEGIFITEVTYDSNKNADLEQSKIITYHQKMLSTKTVLEDNSDAYITYNVTVYNSTPDQYILSGVNYDETFYTDDNDKYNDDISVEITRKGDILSAHESFTFQVTFKYNNDNPKQNILNSYISFVFKKLYSVTYINLENNNYPTSVIENNTLTVKIENNPYDDFIIKMNGIEILNYTFENNVLTVPNINGHVSIEAIEAEIIKIFNKNYKVISAKPSLTTPSTTTEKAGVYKSIDTNSGNPTYYFRGLMQDNYVSFAGFIWRIVRVNEDGTIRLVFQNGINDNKYYRFNGNASSYGMEYTYFTNSNQSGGAKYELDKWYQENLSKYSNYIVTGNYFCEQAKVKVFDFYKSGDAEMVLYSNYTPNFKCATDGNGKGLVNTNIGLLTYDEVAHAGLYYNAGDITSYLYNTSNFWTMSSSGTLHSGAYVPFVWYNKGGQLAYGSATTDPSSYQTLLKPVINIKADVGVTGTGMGYDPFVISTFRDTILANNDIIKSTPTLTSASVNTTDISGLYQSTETNSKQPTYYFRGNVENNYVDFAGFTWRIVRINEDGTVRLVMTDNVNNRGYNFSSNSTGLDTMYYSNTNIENSAKYTLTNWYDTNLSQYSGVIATGNYYCEQAKVKLAYGLSSGNVEMELAANYTPNFKCTTDNNGYGQVISNIGLLTYDEIVYAGGYAGQANNKYFLHSNNNFWTMSPAGVNGGGGAYEWFVDASGNINYVIVNDGFNLRPVINIKSHAVVTGSGIADDHYIIYP